MLAISTKAGGMCFAFPDVCLVPSAAGPVPTPFPNTAERADAEGTVDSVLIENAAVIVLTSIIAMSAGDEPGTAGGVISGTFRGSMQFKSASAKVYAKGKRVVLAGAATAHNGSNANAPVGLQVSPSQAKAVASR